MVEKHKKTERAKRSTGKKMKINESESLSRPGLFRFFSSLFIPLTVIAIKGPVDGAAITTEPSRKLSTKFFDFDFLYDFETEMDIPSEEEARTISCFFFCNSPEVPSPLLIETNEQYNTYVEQYHAKRLEFDRLERNLMTNRDDFEILSSKLVEVEDLKKKEDILRIMKKLDAVLSSNHNFDFKQSGAAPDCIKNEKPIRGSV